MVEGSLLPLRSKALWVLWLWDSHSQARIRVDSSVRYVEWCQEKAWRSDGRQRQEGWRWHRITGRLWNLAFPLLLLLSSPEVASEGIRLGFRIHCPQGSVYTSSCFAGHWASENARHFFPTEMLCVVLISVLSSAVFLGCLSFLLFVCLFWPRPRSVSFWPLNTLFQEVPIRLLCPISSRGRSHPDPSSGLPLPMKSVWTVTAHAVATLFEPVAMMGGPRVPHGTASFYLQGTHCLEFLVVGFHFTTLSCCWYGFSLSSGGGDGFLPYGWLLKSVTICLTRVSVKSMIF